MINWFSKKISDHISGLEDAILEKSFSPAPECLRTFGDSELKIANPFNSDAVSCSSPLLYLSNLLSAEISVLSYCEMALTT